MEGEEAEARVNRIWTRRYTYSTSKWYEASSTTFFYDTCLAIRVFQLDWHDRPSDPICALQKM